MSHHPNDSPVEPSATMTSFRLLERALLLGTVVSPFVLFWFRSKYLWLGLIPLGALILYFWRRDFAVFAHAVFWPMFFLGLLCLNWRSITKGVLVYCPRRASALRCWNEQRENRGTPARNESNEG